MSVDLSSSATDMSPYGAPGYVGLRVCCALADKANMVAAVANLNAVALAYPNTANGVTLAPVQGNSTGLPVATDPTMVYALAIWFKGDLPPTMGGDGQPLWPNSTVACLGATGEQSAAASQALIGDIFGMPIGGY